jgi:histidinol-phosphate aminotransferase
VPIRIRPAVAGLPVYRPGLPAGPTAGQTAGAGAQTRAPHKLSSNENPYPPLPQVLAAAVEACAQMNRYPDMGNTALTAAVATRLDVSPERIAFGTGSVAMLYHLLHALCEPGDEVVYAWRSFEAYPIAVQLTGATARPVPLGPGAVHDLEALAAAVTPHTRVLLLCTPNNPTGPALSHDDVVALLDRLPADLVVVVDEAYVEFVAAPGAVRGLDLLDRPNVVVQRTFSKAYGLAAFRVGYCVAPPEVAAAVRAVALPFGVSGVAQTTAVAALDAEPELMTRVAEIVRNRDELAAALRRLGFDVPDSQANFVWLPAGPRTSAYATAFAAAGLSVRPYAAGDEHDGVRITIGVPEANDRILEVAAGLTR